MPLRYCMIVSWLYWFIFPFLDISFLNQWELLRDSCLYMIAYSPHILYREYVFSLSKLVSRARLKTLVLFFSGRNTTVFCLAATIGALAVVSNRDTGTVVLSGNLRSSVIQIFSTGASTTRRQIPNHSPARVGHAPPSTPPFLTPFVPIVSVFDLGFVGTPSSFRVSH